MAHPRPLDLTLVHEWSEGKVRAVQDCIAGEEPLEIRVNGRPLTVTMRTPGNDLELAGGFLFTEGIVQHPDQITRLEFAQLADGASNPNVVEVELGAEFRTEDMQRNFFAASSCGICGKQTIESVRVRGIKPLDSELTIDADTLCALPATLRDGQAIFGRTGGLHAAALFTKGGKVIGTREDIGRHNAVDKIIGRAFLDNRIPLSDFILLVSGRGGFEIVQKALVAGVPITASVSAPSSLAVQLAREMGMTLIGFLRGWRFIIYSGERRLNLQPEAVNVETE